MSKRDLILIAGGGTGGHIFPALSIAKALHQLTPSIQVHFVGTRQGYESQIIPEAGFVLHFVSSAKLNQKSSLLRRIWNLALVAWGCVQSLVLLLYLRPSVVLGVGGYASAPLVLAASILRIPTALWEPNATPGMANRLLSRWVHRVFLVFEKSRSYLRSSQATICGMPVRAEIEKADPARSARTPSAPFRVLVMGGSQGARSLNLNLAQALEKVSPPLDLCLQVGKQNLQEMKNLFKSQAWESVPSAADSIAFKKSGHFLTLHAFLKDIPERLEWADFVVSRAGASSLAEIAAFGRASLLVPLDAADQHQLANALEFQNASAAVVLDYSALSPSSLAVNIEELVLHPDRLHQMSLRARNLFRPGGAEAIARGLLAMRT
ncbi:MAG: undecaprenyldiphospho-muramoylpentapeptide beta-N-acetylglucosaminyltransferase [Bdellovibrio sp.]